MFDIFFFFFLIKQVGFFFELFFWRYSYLVMMWYLKFEGHNKNTWFLSIWWKNRSTGHLTIKIAKSLSPTRDRMYLVVLYIYKHSFPDWMIQVPIKWRKCIYIWNYMNRCFIFQKIFSELIFLFCTVNNVFCDFSLKFYFKNNL